MAGHYLRQRPEHYQQLVIALSEQRKHQGISQEELSYRLNISERLVNNWECGFKKPGSHMLIKWIAALDGSLEFQPHPLAARDIAAQFPLTDGRLSGYELIEFISATHGRLVFNAVQAQQI